MYKKFLKEYAALPLCYQVGLNLAYRGLRSQPEEATKDTDGFLKTQHAMYAFWLKILLKKQDFQTSYLYDHLKERKYELLEKEFCEFVKAANGLTSKIILETCLLTDEKILACENAKSVHDIAFGRKRVGSYM